MGFDVFSGERLLPCGNILRRHRTEVCFRKILEQSLLRLRCGLACFLLFVFSRWGPAGKRKICSVVPAKQRASTSGRDQSGESVP